MFLTLMPSSINAVYCENSDKAKQKLLASNINAIYFEKVNSNNVVFDIRLTNITQSLVVKDVFNNKSYSYGYDKNNPSEITISNFPQGKAYKFEVYTNIPYCEGQLLHTVYVTVPRYNAYHNDALCQGISEYKFCQRWIDFEMTYNEFKKNVTDYKNSLVKEPPEEPIVQEDTNLIDYVIAFWISNYYYILGTIIVVCCLFMYLIYRKNNIKL